MCRRGWGGGDGDVIARGVITHIYGGMYLTHRKGGTLARTVMFTDPSNPGCQVKHSSRRLQFDTRRLRITSNSNKINCGRGQPRLLPTICHDSDCAQHMLRCAAACSDLQECHQAVAHGRLSPCQPSHHPSHEQPDSILHSRLLVFRLGLFPPRHAKGRARQAPRSGWRYRRSLPRWIHHPDAAVRTSHKGRAVVTRNVGDRTSLAAVNRQPYGSRSSASVRTGADVRSCTRSQPRAVGILRFPVHGRWR